MLDDQACGCNNIGMVHGLLGACTGCFHILRPFLTPLLRRLCLQAVANAAANGNAQVAAEAIAEAASGGELLIHVRSRG